MHTIAKVRAVKTGITLTRCLTHDNNEIWSGRAQGKQRASKGKEKQKVTEACEASTSKASTIESQSASDATPSADLHEQEHVHTGMVAEGSLGHPSLGPFGRNMFTLASWPQGHVHSGMVADQPLNSESGQCLSWIDRATVA